jgi:hypothetical protein
MALVFWKRAISENTLSIIRKNSVPILDRIPVTSYRLASFSFSVFRGPRGVSDHTPFSRYDHPTS